MILTMIFDNFFKMINNISGSKVDKFEEGDFTCPDGEVISANYRCDGMYADCEGGADEANCDKDDNSMFGVG